MNKTFQKIILLLLCMFFAIACGGGGGGSGSNGTNTSSANADYPIDESLNFLVISTSDSATQLQKDAAKYISDRVVKEDDPTLAYDLLLDLKEIELADWGVYDFNVLNGLNNLEKVTFKYYDDGETSPYITKAPDELNMARLTHLPNLKEIYFNRCDNNRIKNLNEFDSLDTISITAVGNSKGNSFSFLKNVTNFNKLIIENLSYTSADFTQIGTTAIETLEFEEGEVLQLDGLENLATLKEVNFLRVLMHDFSVLDNIKQIEKLTIYCYGLEDVADTSANNLAVMSNLVELHAQWSGLTLEGLNKLTKLEILDLQENQLRDEDMTWDELPKSLKKIYLQYNDYLFTTLDGIEVLTNLEFVHLMACSDLENIDALLELPNLKYVNVSGTKVADAVVNALRDKGIEVTYK